MKKVTVYEKHFKAKDGSKEFTKTFARTEQGSVVECHFTKNAGAELTVSKLNWPVVILLDGDDYFIDSSKTYTTKDGEVKNKDILVIKSWDSISQGEFKKRTLDDIDAERAD